MRSTERLSGRLSRPSSSHRMTRTLSLLVGGARALQAIVVPGARKAPNSRNLPNFPIFDLRPLSIQSSVNLRVVVAQMEESSVSQAGISSSAGRRERVGEVDCFELSPSSVLKLQKGDITTWFVDGLTDAIVNAANEGMLGGGGVDGAIHRAAGPELNMACYEMPEVLPGVRCSTGEARITPAFQLPVSRVIHTVGPVYGVVQNAEFLLRSAYRNSLELAKDKNIQYIAFPAISCGVYRYPLDEASKIAITTVKEFPNDFREVHFVLFSDDIYRAWLEAALEFM